MAMFHIVPQKATTTIFRQHDSWSVNINIYDIIKKICTYIYIYIMRYVRISWYITMYHCDMFHIIYHKILTYCDIVISLNMLWSIHIVLCNDLIICHYIIKIKWYNHIYNDDMVVKWCITIYYSIVEWTSYGLSIL